MRESRLVARPEGVSAGRASGRSRGPGAARSLPFSVDLFGRIVYTAVSDNTHMDPNTTVKLIAGVLALVLVGVILMRRKKKKGAAEDDF